MIWMAALGPAAHTSPAAGLMCSPKQKPSILGDRMNAGKSRLAVALMLTLHGWAAQPRAVDAATAFTYQGQLLLSGSAVNDTCSMQFRLYNQAAGGTLVGTVGPQAVLVTSGVFTTLLDFGGGALGTGNRWLEISVDCGTGLTLLQPRQPLTAAPYAYFADTIASNAIGSQQLQGNAVSSDKIVDNTIDTADIKNGTITFSDVDVNSVQRRVTGICAPNTAMSAIGSDGTVTCVSAGGDITAVTAGTGLTGGGTVGAVSLSVSFGGNGSATSAARSDHNHFGQEWSGSSAGAALQVTNSNVDGGTGVRGTSTSGTGVNGFTSGGNVAGVLGEASAINGIGVIGITTGDFGVGAYAIGKAAGAVGASDGGIGVVGSSSSGLGGQFTSETGIALRASADSFEFPDLVLGGNGGVYDGVVASEPGQPTGDLELRPQDDVRIYLGQNGIEASKSFFTVYNGNANQLFRVEEVVSSASGVTTVNGSLLVTGQLIKGGGSFKIDHPLDPANKYLSHSFVESPDMKNIYDGVVELDAAGEAQVELPEWFEALNRDFRYQLTCVGAFAPVYVADKIQDNTFRIAGGSPGMEISWQVTGSRNDAYAGAHPIAVEEEKSEDEKGLYLYPLEHGQPASLGIATQDPAK